MLVIEGVNIWAVIVVWVIYMAVGAYWYSPAGFAKAWKKHTGIDMMKIPTNQANKIIMFVAMSALIQSLTLAVMFNSLAVSDLVTGLSIGLLLWLGLVTATTVGTTFYSQRSWKFLWLNSAYFLIVMAIASVTFSVWQ